MRDMRDRLEHLHHVKADSEGFSSVELDSLSEPEPADSELGGILNEAQRIRLEIQQIQNDISELREVNYQTINRTSFHSVTKRDSNAIGADIKHRVEAVLQQLHMMNDIRRELEAQRGPFDPAVRIARTQYHYLSNTLQEVMFSYSDTEMSHREACKCHIQRQMEVVGMEATDKELKERTEGEELSVFSIQMEGKSSRSALLQIESRHQDLLELENRIQNMQELFLDVAVLMEEQGAVVRNIEQNVQDVEVIIQDGTTELEKATASDKNNPFKKMFCGCCPCYHSSF